MSEVVLLSAFPEAHDALVRDLRRNGVRVRVPRGGTGLRFLGEPDLVLVDIAHGAGLSPRSVAALNRRRGRTLVVALHEGSLEAAPRDAEDLAVEGFCRSDDWRPLVGAFPSGPGAEGARTH